MYQTTATSSASSSARGVRVTLIAALAAATACLSGCSFTGSVGTGTNLGSGSSVPEREHQDAQVLANVMRSDLTEIQSMGATCENVDSGTHCTEVVVKAKADIDRALADIARLRVPSYVKSDTDSLIAALQRASRACGPVTANASDRIAEAYAANEFDTAVKHVMAAYGKLAQDSY